MQRTLLNIHGCSRSDCNRDEVGVHKLKYGFFIKNVNVVLRYF